MTFSRGSIASPVASPSALASTAVSASAGESPGGLVLVDLHDPAALQAAFGLQEDRAGLLQELERVRPEMQPEDVAFPRQQVVVDVEAAHRLQVAADDAVGDERGEVGRRVAAVLDVVERRRADLEPRLVVLVPLGHAGVEVPAVVVEARRVGERAHLVEPLVLELAKADGDVGDLHAGIVDVVLDLDLASEEAQQPAEGVAERGVAQVPDVRGLVRVDGRVLDDRLAGLARRGPSRWRDRRHVTRQPAPELRRPIEEEVHVAVRRRLDAGEPVDLARGAPTISCAMARGALRRRRASSKASGTEKSPSARRGGISTGIAASAGSSAGMS